MASIKGFQMKNIKNTLGREGYGCTATMYLNGKKIGTYADYGDGAMEDVNYVSKEAEEEMMKVVIAYAKEHPNPLMEDLYTKNPDRFKSECERFKKYHPYIPEADITIRTMASNSVVYIVGDFLALYDVEKTFKKKQKQGYGAISVEENKKTGQTFMTSYPASWSEERIKKEAGDNPLYMSLSDFERD